ncbi:hypothetical protein [Paraburkholderia sp. A1RO-1]|uniref:hypothetical protein n=1 Tax=Paraburkholderia sp. A1RO-1 TaxID=3028368 RepID=UPI003B826056
MSVTCARWTGSSSTRKAAFACAGVSTTGAAGFAGEAVAGAASLHGAAPGRTSSNMQAKAAISVLRHCAARDCKREERDILGMGGKRYRIVIAVRAQVLCPDFAEQVMDATARAA